MSEIVERVAKAMARHRWAEFDEEYREAGRELARNAIEAMQPWLPIETAPKDGTRVLLLTGRQEVAVGKWLDNSATSHPWQGWSTDLGPSVRATHWMPLPEPLTEFRT